MRKPVLLRKKIMRPGWSDDFKWWYEDIDEKSRKGSSSLISDEDGSDDEEPPAVSEPFDPGPSVHTSMWSARAA